MVLHRANYRIEHRLFRDLPELLQPGDLLVRNDTRVMAARLNGAREDTGGAVEALLVRERDDATWEVLMRPARQAVPGRRFVFAVDGGDIGATTVGREDDLVVLAFDRPIDPSSIGEMPLPPYITRFSGDASRYQTVYARESRSAAAPTAGLHFTSELFQRLEQQSIHTADVTLEVGPGTFQPVKVEDPRDHVLHKEHVTIPVDTSLAINGAREEGRRVVAVGTTVVRTLEHVHREYGEVLPYAGWTGLKLLPGAAFGVVDALITNFHLPRSTLLMLVCAFAGTEFALEAYRTAVEEQYRFYSFGDAMLILP